MGISRGRLREDDVLSLLRVEVLNWRFSWMLLRSPRRGRGRAIGLAHHRSIANLRKELTGLEPALGSSRISREPLLLRPKNEVDIGTDRNHDREHELR